MSKLLIIGTPHIDAELFKQMFDAVNANKWETVVVDKASALGKSEAVVNWGDSMSDPLDDIANLQLVLQENDYIPKVSGPEKLLMMCGAGLAADSRRYMVAPEPIIELQPEHNKPWYNDHRNNRSKKLRRKL